MNNFLYCVKQGLSNFIKNPLHSLASTATVSACIFLFCLFLGLVANITEIAMEAETNVGITVFFTEDAGEADKEQLRKDIENFGGVKEIRYISADEAWDSFKEDYFGDKAEELSAAFSDDNPLSQSDSFEIFMESLDDQPLMAEFLTGKDIVREVNYANSLVDTLKKMNRGIYILSAVIIGVLFAVSVFLISNTISVAAAFRKRENQIMRLIGAKGFMIRAPFVVEGLLIGTIGAAVPLWIVKVIYEKAAAYLTKQVSGFAAGSAIKDVIQLIPLENIFPQMAMAGLILGIGMGFIVSEITIQRHLRV